MLSEEILINANAKYIKHNKILDKYHLKDIIDTKNVWGVFYENIIKDTEYDKFQDYENDKIINNSKLILLKNG